MLAVYLIKQHDYKKYNFLVLLIITIAWIPANIMIIKIPSHSLNNWQLPLALSLYIFLEVIWRIPLGMLSRKIVSRAVIIKGTIIAFMFFLLLGIILNNQYSVWLIVIGISLFTATYGLHNQYHLENYSLERVFQSVVILTFVPFISKTIAIIFVQSLLYADVQIDLRWIYLTSILINLIPLAIIFSIKEDKSKVALDRNIPNNFYYRFGLKQGSILFIQVAINVFISRLIFEDFIFTNSGLSTEYWQYASNSLLFVLLPVYLYLGRLLIVFFGIRNMKYGFSLLIIIGISISLFAWEATSSDGLFIAGILIAQIGCSVVMLLLFGTAQHADHKNPELILAMFLTSRSFAGSGSSFTVNYLVINKGSKYITLIFSLALGLSFIFLVFQIIFDNIINKLYTSVIDYEFKEDIKFQKYSHKFK